LKSATSAFRNLRFYKSAPRRIGAAEPERISNEWQYIDRNLAGYGGISEPGSCACGLAPLEASTAAEILDFIRRRISISNVFLGLLPKIVVGTAYLPDTPGPMAHILKASPFLPLLIGLVTFYGLERTVEK
jgi:hypothetical protein